MSYSTVIGIFLWKHWKCFRVAWLRNLFMIVVPIMIVWFQIHVISGTGSGVSAIFDPIHQVTFTNLAEPTICWHEFVTSPSLQNQNKQTASCGFIDILIIVCLFFFCDFRVNYHLIFHRIMMISLCTRPIQRYTTELWKMFAWNCRLLKNVSGKMVIWRIQASHWFNLEISFLCRSPRIPHGSRNGQFLPFAQKESGFLHNFWLGSIGKEQHSQIHDSNEKQ